MTALVIALLLVLLYLLTIKVYEIFWHRGLTADIDFAADYAFEGDKTELIETVSNDKLLPLPAVEIDFNLGRGLRFTDSSNSTVSDKLYRRDVFSLGARRRITRTLELNCAHRGYYTLDGLGLMGKDLFLTSKYLQKRPLSREFYVYPRRVSSERLAVPYNRLMGEVLSRQRLFADPFEFGGIRDYMLTDPMKYVNWKSSAKAGKLVVNLHDSSLSQQVLIVLDTYDSLLPADSELNEESIRIAAALCERLLSAGVSLSLLGNGKDVITGKTLCMNGLKGRDATEVRRTLSRLLMNDDNEIHSMVKPNPDDGVLTILISKNLSAAEFFEGAEGMWICPYKIDKPVAPQGKFSFIPWEDQSSLY